jgi:hypothetical protein
MSLDTTSGSRERLRYGDKAVINIVYTNASDVPLHNVSFKLSLTGDAPLFKQIDPSNGLYDSIKQSILWDKSNVVTLGTLAPRANGTLRIVVPIVTSGTNSPTLKAVLTGLASTEETDDVVTTVSKEWAVEGSATISARTGYKNSSFPNTGPIPPVANTETTYTAQLVVSAQNALVNTRASFILPSYVSWRSTSSDQDKISYDRKTRTVTWAIGDMTADQTLTADIGLTVKPSQSHVDRAPSITSGIVLDADEEVSQSHIRTTISPLTTFISGEAWGDINPSLVIDGQ